jgi:hypothetical protein
VPKDSGKVAKGNTQFPSPPKDEEAFLAVGFSE